ncbi:MAG: ABC transporter substrate-binding protein [Dehalococcoidia bacterium]|nr:ABC transporter substrate-binding protein [Dehalococcoidia bacterium]
MFVTALRVVHGDDAAREWSGSSTTTPASSSPTTPAIVQAVANGEVDVGFVNHYYLFRYLEEQGEDFGARNYYFTNGDVGGLMNVAGAGIVASTEEMALAEELLSYLLSEQSQQYFATETFEFPLVEGVQPDHRRRARARAPSSPSTSTSP